MIDLFSFARVFTGHKISELETFLPQGREIVRMDGDNLLTAEVGFVMSVRPDDLSVFARYWRIRPKSNTFDNIKPMTIHDLRTRSTSELTPLYMIYVPSRSIVHPDVIARVLEQLLNEQEGV